MKTYMIMPLYVCLEVAICYERENNQWHVVLNDDSLQLQDVFMSNSLHDDCLFQERLDMILSP